MAVSLCSYDRNGLNAAALLRSKFNWAVFAESTNKRTAVCWSRRLIGSKQLAAVIPTADWSIRLTERWRPAPLVSAQRGRRSHPDPGEKRRKEKESRKEVRRGKRGKPRRFNGIKTHAPAGDNGGVRRRVPYGTFRSAFVVAAADSLTELLDTRVSNDTKPTQLPSSSSRGGWRDVSVLMRDHRASRFR